jgi:ferredoxin
MSHTIAYVKLNQAFRGLAMPSNLWHARRFNGLPPLRRSNMRIVVDFDLCQSHGLCTEAAPELFQIRDDGFLYVLNETPGPELAGKLEKAVLECPTGAITIKDD